MMITPRMASAPYYSQLGLSQNYATIFSAYLFLSGVPAKAFLLDEDALDYSNGQVGECARRVMDFIDGKAMKPFAYLHSENRGTGKTLMAGLGATRWAYHRTSMSIVPEESVRFVNVPYFLMRLRSSFTDRGISEDDVLGPLIECDLLVLDDLGTEKPSEHAVRSQYTLLDQRLSRCLPTILTSNVSIEGLYLRFKDGDAGLASRIVDRLIEGCEVIQFPEECSFRLDGRNEISFQRDLQMVKEVASKSRLFEELRHEVGY